MQNATFSNAGVPDDNILEEEVIFLFELYFHFSIPIYKVILIIYLSLL